MPSPYYLGQSPDEALGNTPRFFYAMRRNEDGELFLVRSDQLIDKDSIDINAAGASSDNFEDFEAGVDFFDGLDENHDPVYKNLVWTQYRWDNRSALYYISPEGRLIQRLNQNYIYPTGHSS
jgi:hypothetical protein